MKYSQNINFNSIKLPSAIDSVLSTPLHPTGTGKTFFHSQTVANNKTFNASSTERTYSIFHYARLSLSLLPIHRTLLPCLFLPQSPNTKVVPPFVPGHAAALICMRAQSQKSLSCKKWFRFSQSRRTPRQQQHIPRARKHPHTHPSVLCQTGIGGVTRLFACMSWNKFTPPQNSGCDGGWNQPGSLRLANMWKHTHTLSLFIVGGEMKTKLKPPPPPISPLSSGQGIVVCVSKSERNTVLRAHKHTHTQLDKLITSAIQSK